MRRFAVSAVCALSALVMAAPDAQAAGPAREKVPDFNATFPAGVVCPFEVAAVTLVNREYQKTFFDASGNPTRAIITGSLAQRFTNNSNGRSMDLNVGGPVFITFNADGSVHVVLTGHSFIGLFAGDVGGPDLIYVVGKATLDQAADRTITNVQTQGNVVHVCAALA